MTVADTLLSFDFGDAPYSNRGITQSFANDPAATKMRRTVNGRLDDLSDSAFRKYVSTVTCRDMNPPALDGVWPGRQVVVDCIFELSYPTSGGSPSRTVVSGSSRESGSYTFYRPRLTMRVIDFSVDTDEYGAVVGWTLNLAEV
jgi:hypothetical protein